MSARCPLVKNASAIATRSGVLRSPSRSGSSPSFPSSSLTSSCMLLFYICAFLATAAASAGGTIAEDADALYEDRTNLASATRAAELLTAATAADPKAFEPAWKLARICYWLGGHGPEAGRRGFL